MAQSSKTFDIILVGGGIMGSSTAYNLTRADPSIKVAVVEKDPAYEWASTTLSMTNARIQFSMKQNIQISQFAFEILENFENQMALDDKPLDIAYRREGNLFLVNDQMEHDAKTAFELQKSLGCQIHWWMPDQIRRAYPLYQPGAMQGTFGPQDGHFDAYAVLMGYKAKAISQGATYLHGEVTRLLADAGRIEGVKLKNGDELKAGAVVNCAGAWCSQIAQTAHIELPVVPTKRQIFVLDTEVKPEGPLPLTVLPSGLYFRTEGNLIVLGKSMDEDPIGFDFSWDHDRFVEHLWAELAEFVPAFEALKVTHGWAGLYAVNTLDGNAILGQWPELKGFYLANGFSGHGLQQAPAVGRYMSELILDLPHALDLSIFGPERILEKRPLSEGGLV